MILKRKGIEIEIEGGITIALTYRLSTGENISASKTVDKIDDVMKFLAIQTIDIEEPVRVAPF